MNDERYRRGDDMRKNRRVMINRAAFQNSQRARARCSRANQGDGDGKRCMDRKFLDGTGMKRVEE